MNARTLLREVEKLEAERLSRRPDIPADRATFARDLGIIPDPWQDRLLRSDAPRVLLNCCRQSGKSTMAAVIALHRALAVPGSLVLCLAPALRQSQELFGKVLGFYRDLGRPIPAVAEQRLGLELSNGSRIAALPGSERTVRGFSGVDLLIVDEAARVDDALVYSVRPMLAVSGGTMMLLSTPYGRRGVFYEEWTGEAGEDWQRYEIPANQCPRIPPAFLAAERASMPEWWYAQEYGCEFRETEDQLWTHEMIEGARDDELAEYRFEGDEELWNTA
jgi:Terminase large subunit, T4likevirus-type, N-terminal